MPAETGFSSVLLSMLLVLGCLAALPWILKRLRLQQQARPGSLRVVESLSLGPRERLIVVHADGERLLLGVAGQGVQLIKSLGPAPEQDSAPAIGGGSAFSQVLQQWRSRSQESA
jgi:flagellar protein FliO/FliZ